MTEEQIAETRQHDPALQMARKVRKMAQGGDGYYAQSDIADLHRVADMLERCGTPNPEPVAWQRHHPHQGWTECLPQDVEHYRSQGQTVRALYEREPAAPADDGAGAAAFAGGACNTGAGELEALARQFHDGPLMAADHYFDPESEQGKWCLDVARFFAERSAAPAAQPPVIPKAIRMPKLSETQEFRIGDMNGVDAYRKGWNAAVRAMRRAARDAAVAPEPAMVELAVWYGEMPESNGRRNWTASLHRKGGEKHLDAFCFARSEYPDRVRYEADRMRWVIGELNELPDILAYDADLHSGYREPHDEQQAEAVETARAEGVLEGASIARQLYQYDVARAIEAHHAVHHAQGKAGPAEKAERQCLHPFCGDRCGDGGYPT